MKNSLNVSKHVSAGLESNTERADKVIVFVTVFEVPIIYAN
jgi:hypothetical protein